MIVVRNCVLFTLILLLYIHIPPADTNNNSVHRSQSQNTNHRLQMLRGSKNQYKKSKLNSLSITDNSKVKKPTTNDIKRIKLIKKKLKLRQLTKAKKKKGDRNVRQQLCLQNECYENGLKNGQIMLSQLTNSIKRINRYNTFARKSGQKLGKYKFAEDVVKQMMRSLGGSVLLEENKHVCRGRFGTEEGEKAFVVYGGLKNCEATILANCDLQVNSTANFNTISDCEKNLEDIM